MHRRLVISGVIAICLALAILVFLALFDANHYRPQIEASLRAKFDRDVRLGEITLNYLPVGFRIHDAVIWDDPSFGGDQPFAAIETLVVQPRVLPLLRGVVEINSLQLSNPRLELIRNDKGTWNFTRLLNGRPLSLAKLKIENGQLAITDRFEREPRAVYDHIDLTLFDYVPLQPFSVEARAHMPGTGEQIIAFSGKAGPIQGDLFSHTPLEGRLELREVELSGLQRFLKAEALANSDGVLTGTGEIKNNGILAGKGRVAIRDAKIRGVKLEYPIAADYDISKVTSETTISINEMNLKLNQTPVSVTGTIDPAKTPAALDLRVRGSDGSVGEIARLAAAFGVAFNASNDVSGRLSFDVHAKGPADRPALDGSASARDIRITGGGVPDPVDVKAIDLSFSPGQIRSNEFIATTGRTHVTAQAILDGYATDTPQLHASVNTGNAEVGELVRVARAYGFSSDDGLTGSGTISLNVSVDGPLRQTEKWTYSGSGAVSNAILRLHALGGKPLGVQKARLRFSANSLMVDDLSFSIGETTARGKLTARNLAAPRVEFSLSADKINVAEWHEMAQSRPENTQQSPGRNAAQTSLLARATGSGQLAAQSVVYDQLVLSNVRSAVTLDEGIITMSPITAGLYNGHEVGTVVVNVRAQPVLYSVSSKLQNIDANHFLSSVSSLKEMLYGVMSASTNGRFSANGSASDIARTLNGTVSLKLADGRLANMDLLHQLATIGRFGRTARAVEPFTKVIRLNGDFSINNGIARTSNLEAIIDDGSLAADGTVDLVDQKVNLHLTAVLSEEYSRSVGGTRIGGLMSTVLPNQRGEFVIPILLTGTFQHPQFAPDLEKIAWMKLQNLLPTLSNPDRLSTGIPGQIFRTKPGPITQSTPEQPQPEQPRPEKLLRGILEGVLGNGRK